MEPNETNFNETHEHETRSGSGNGKYWLLGGALGLALGANAFLVVRSNHLSDEIAAVREGNVAQYDKLMKANSTAADENHDLLDRLERSVRDAHGNAASAQAAIKRAQADTKKQDEQIIQRLEAQKNDLTGELSQLKDETTNKFGQVTTEVGGVKTDVEGVKTEIATEKTQLEQHAADLKRMTGDMGVMSGLIATNGKDLDTLRALGERNYYEFSLAKGQKQTRVGNVMIALKKADPKHNRYTVEVMADDKLVEKKDRTINEPVQIYVAGSRQPNEIVVNQVKKDTITGYLATPKVTVSKR